MTDRTLENKILEALDFIRVQKRLSWQFQVLECSRDPLVRDTIASIAYSRSRWSLTSEYYGCLRMFTVGNEVTLKSLINHNVGLHSEIACRSGRSELLRTLDCWFTGLWHRTTRKTEFHKRIGALNLLIWAPGNCEWLAGLWRPYYAKNWSSEEFRSVKAGSSKSWRVQAIL